MTQYARRAKVTLEITVDVETDPGTDVPGLALELPYDYLVVRDAKGVSVEFVGGDGRLIQEMATFEELFDAFDPDGWIKSEVVQALQPIIHMEEEDYGD